jgi:hypothetical protein
MPWWYWSVRVSNFKVYFILIAVLSLVACSGNYTPELLPEPNAIKEGRGLFSNDDGTLTLYASDECLCESPKAGQAVRSTK